MSRIDELIERLCPDGVEYRRIGEICLDTKNIEWSSMSAEEERAYIDLTSVNIVTHHIDNVTPVNRDTAPSRAQQLIETDDILFATTRPAQMRVCIVPQLYDEQVCSTGYCVIRPNQSTASTHFLMHILSGGRFQDYLLKKQQPGNYPSISSTLLKQYRIPVPPMEVQQEIVRTLDSFAKLEAKLEAELEARKAQYEYYRDELLTFDGRGVNWTSLGEVATIGRGTPITKRDVIPGNVPVVLGGRQPAYYHNRANHTGEVLVVSRSGANAGYVSYWNQPVFVSDGFTVDAGAGTTARYLFHVLKSQQDEMIGMNRGSGVPHITTGMLKKMSIPMPALKRQRELVESLDRFDAFVNDISVGLPAEIAARRQQYAYYRDRLLSFKERVA